VSSKNVNRSLNHLVLDVALTVGFVVSFRPSLTGLAVHEWLGLALGAGLIVHLVGHWKWVVGVTKRLAGRLPLRTRVYYLLDAALLFFFTTIIGSGVAMSGAVLPALGLNGSSSLGWVTIHKLASFLTLVLLGAKLVLHRNWIAQVAKRHFGPGEKRTSNVDCRSRRRA
jgi:hypothetical protein